MRPSSVNLRSFHIGVDLGQRVDYTAFVVVEQQVVATQKKDPVTYEYLRERRLCVRLADRVRLGQGFRDVVQEVERLTHSPALDGEAITTCVDATGMGIVVTEDLQRAKLRGELLPVVITGGLESSYRSGFYPTPRTELLLGVQRALEQEKLGMASGMPGLAHLQEELKAMQKVQSVRGPRFETTGAHDDLVFALALALFGMRRRMLPVDGDRVRRRMGVPY